MTAARSYRDLVVRPPLPADLRTDKRAGERVLTRNDRPAWIVSPTLATERPQLNAEVRG